MKRFKHLLCIGSLLFSVSVYAGKRKREDDKENMAPKSLSVDSSLFSAIKSGSVDGVRNLLDSGSEANSVNADSNSALNFAFDQYLYCETIRDPGSKKYLNIIALLLKSGANITDLNYDSILLIVQEATIYNQYDIVRLILEKLPNNLLEKGYFLPYGSNETDVVILREILKNERERRSKALRVTNNHSLEAKFLEDLKQVNIDEIMNFISHMSKCSKLSRSSILENLSLVTFREAINHASTYGLNGHLIIQLETLYTQAEAIQAVDPEDEDKGKEEETEELEPTQETVCEDEIESLDIPNLDDFENSTHTNSTHNGESERSAFHLQNVMPIRSQCTFGQSNEK